MPLEHYVSKRFSKRDLGIIQIANKVIVEYQADDYSLTLRQLYYQFVSRDILPNHIKMYKLLGSVINDARAQKYIEKYGDQSWELDALDPKVLAGLVTTCAKALITDIPAWKAQEALQKEGREQLGDAERRMREGE